MVSEITYSPPWEFFGGAWNAVDDGGCGNEQAGQCLDEALGAEVPFPHK